MLPPVQAPSANRARPASPRPPANRGVVRMIERSLITSLDHIAVRSLIASSRRRLRRMFVGLVQFAEQQGVDVGGDLQPIDWRLHVRGAGGGDDVGGDDDN